MFPRPPGRLVDVGGFRLHLNTAGASGPLVVFDAALAGSSLSWTLVQPSVAKFARTFVYDRAGFGWSDRGPMPRTAGRAADELRVLLDRAGERPPFLLVGHSFGGLVMRIFAARYRADVAALVLVDPAQPEDWVHPAPKEQLRIDRGVQLCRQGMTAARFGFAKIVSGLVTAGAVPIARRLADLFSGGGIGIKADGILTPFWKLPPDVRQVLAKLWTRPRFFEALGSQIEHISTSAAEALEASGRGYGDLPLVTLSEANPSPYRMQQQEAVARLSSRGRHLIAATSGHWIPLDEPAWVASAIEEIATSTGVPASNS